jgi:hypothetical protein
MVCVCVRPAAIEAAVIASAELAAVRSKTPVITADRAAIRSKATVITACGAAVLRGGTAAAPHHSERVPL